MEKIFTLTEMEAQILGTFLSRFEKLIEQKYIQNGEVIVINLELLKEYKKKLLN